jgi:hypothetical protein
LRYRVKSEKGYMDGNTNKIKRYKNPCRNPDNNNEEMMETYHACMTEAKQSDQIYGLQMESSHLSGTSPIMWGALLSVLE